MCLMRQPCVLIQPCISILFACTGQVGIPLYTSKDYAYLTNETMRVIQVAMDEINELGFCGNEGRVAFLDKVPT